MTLATHFNDSLQGAMLARLGEPVRLTWPGNSADTKAVVDERFADAGDDFAVGTLVYTLELLQSALPALTRKQMSEQLSVTLLARPNETELSIGDVQAMGAGVTRLVCTR
ncbi:hypothetical protein JN531_012740 [Flagellatimonas centrodinii]|uniref:hypothetical protein n=1 Tax=Flagellatimonas centrodinii TaxID=2806210 RepID=UPI001FEE9354|nr:hypothetical protein [Flagellatimonas centrodinii]ULQ45967.1 hypothetical protein JN531_012740 [Flagellatimonas centrodinii]